MIIFLKFFNRLRIEFLTYLKGTYKQIIWRTNNTHNSTNISKNVKNPSLITVGVYSYGTLNVESFENKNERLCIGNYVSIASNVIFILGGNHQITTFTTYPLRSMFLENYPEGDARTKGAIIIEDEVWIGNNVIVMSGVTIGKGAIIAAGSVVTKDVEPYTIVGGNPAKFIKWRYSKEIIEALNEVKLMDFSPKTLIKNQDLFYQDLDLVTLNQIKELTKDGCINSNCKL